ncbi:DUF6308 family protein [Zhihengliuella halotolerans]|uniref:Uncharacterized protein n=1 Tax=Zhihengliuella halotolerans TaxID=370736 RepID=A0A4Q8AEG6_9MICC|nr:DUF6308 family protein [Zhihengliuella halotolerans]RZU62677.1 hypothetical protein EV380_2278 [Zhihengliuella halotolerans]
MSVQTLFDKILVAESEVNIGEAKAIRYLDEYFGVRPNGRPLYSGSHFETFGGGGRSNPHEFTAADLLSTSLLSKPVTGQAAVGILGPMATELSRCLSELPFDAAFETLTKYEFEALLGNPESPGQRVWDLLRQHDDKWDLGPVTASKLLARKRPHLIPIYDSFVEAEVGLGGSGQQWITWNAAFQRGDFVQALRRIRHASVAVHLSLLRTLDIVLWMHHAKTAGTTEESGLSAPPIVVDKSRAGGQESPSPENADDRRSGSLVVWSQPVTDKDRARSNLRIPAASKHVFPAEPEQVLVDLDGVLRPVNWRPNGARSGTLGLGVETMRSLRERNERIRIEPIGERFIVHRRL